MAVYLDDYNQDATVKNGKGYVRGKWRHLVADTHEELMAVARHAGLNPKWIQHEGTPLEHFDITGSKVKACLDAGAQLVSWRFTGQLAMHKRDAEHAEARCSLETRCHQTGCGACYPDEVKAPDGKQERVLVVTGPRKGVSRETVAEGLRRYFRPDVTLVVGGAEGVDKDSADLWREWGGKVEEHKVTEAEWDAKPKTAGFDRNDRMIARAKNAGQARVLAFDLPCNKDRCNREKPHNTHGTSHCAENAGKAGLKVERYPGDGSEPARPEPKPEPKSQPEPGEGEPETDAEKTLKDAGMLNPDQSGAGKHPYSRGGIAPEGSWLPPHGPYERPVQVHHGPCPDCREPTVIDKPGDDPARCAACVADAIALTPKEASEPQVSRHYPTPEHFPAKPDPGFAGPVRTSAQWAELDREADKETSR